MSFLASAFHRVLPFQRRFGTTTRIAFSMAMWGATVLLILCAVGVLDDGHKQKLKDRAKLCELFAIHCSQHLSNNAPDQVQVLIDSFSGRHDELISVGLRDTKGLLVFGTKDHHRLWATNDEANQISVPVFQGKTPYGHFEVAFEPILRSGFLGLLQLPSLQLILIATALNFAGFLFLIRRSFHQYDPSQTIPARVQSAFDTMSESILVLDSDRRIMLANRRLTSTLNCTADSLQGQPVESLPWRSGLDGIFNSPSDLESASDNERRDCLVEMTDGDGNPRIYKMNHSEIRDRDQSCGVLVSLDDVTEMEKQRGELRRALTELEASQSELELQNEQLQFLATRDPMTGCFNRRSFFESFEKIWHGSVRYGHDLSCVMVDVDHFKSINDNHGHAAGDEVLQGVSEALQSTARDADIVCRYGGEEFCVLLPNVDIEGARLAAERFRRAIAALDFHGLTVTASLGCSDRLQNAETAEAMLEQADQSLYHAKRTGRNRVVGFHELTNELHQTEEDPQVLEAQTRLEQADQLLSELTDTGSPLPQDSQQG